MQAATSSSITNSRKILEAFHRAGVECIPLKGAFLAEHIYGNIAVRPMSDVDLLVKDHDQRRVKDALLNLGYERLHQIEEVIKEHHHFCYQHPEHGLLVEVHWDLVDSFAGSAMQVDLDGLWERSDTATLASVPVRALSPEDQVLHLCVHMCTHAFEMGLRPLCDILETLCCYGEEFDWEVVGQRARQWKAERRLYVSLWLARKLLDAPVPMAYLESAALQEPDQKRLTLAEELLFASVEKPAEVLPVGLSSVQLWEEEGTAAKVVRFWRRIFVSRQMLATIYSVSPDSWRVFLYYPVRVRDLLIRHRGVISDRLFKPLTRAQRL